ncbi:MAG: N-6 DNA methylase [Firmicutes bacterium]|nr:N-6 DNA methylase [Bacillota bacterium]
MPRISYQQIQQNISEIANREYYSPTIIYDLLLAYGKPKATVTKLQNGVNNFARNDGVLLKDAVFFKIFPAGTVLESKVEQLKHDDFTERYRPRYLIATDLQNIAAYDRRQESSLSTKLRDLDKDFTFFYGLSGNEVNTGQKEEAYADRKAAERMKELYDEIVRCNSDRILAEDLNFRHDLNIFFSRLLFCYFAEDTDLFEPKQFTNSVKNYTKMDGSDLPYFFEQLFESLDSKPYEKQGMVDPFNKFPYVNGTIFDTKKHAILIPKFNAQARHLLIQLAESDWSDVNPDIFGTIFQGIVDAQKRDENGMDYTSVTNIEKVINPLFMDELWAEYDKAKDSINKLNKLWSRISKIKIFDPACGSGNFLIIAYKRLRELEQEIIRTIDEVSPAGIGIRLDSQIKLDHFFGIELEDFPRELAVLSMFIAAHQMNIKFEEEFGKKLTIIPIIDFKDAACG